MKTIEAWSWAFESKIRGQVDGESFCSMPVVRVDVEKKVVECKGGDAFQLGAQSSDDPTTLEQVEEIVRTRYEGGVR